MRHPRFLILASTLFVLAVSAPATGSTADNPTRTSLPASEPLATTCAIGGVAASRWLGESNDPSETWGRKRRQTFAKLLLAADRFASAVALHETDHSVMAGACDISAARATEQHVFRRTLETLVVEENPRSPVMTLPEADSALNAAFGEVMAVEDTQNLAWGSVEKAGIRKAERAWLAYRDAFVAFAATFETSGVAERLKIELTMRRAASLEAFLAD